MIKTKKLNGLIGISIGAMFIVISSYSIAFIFLFDKSKLSSSPSDWGTFGDYFGGLLNPLISFLNVYITIEIAKAVQSFSREQSERHERVQLDQSKMQAAAQHSAALHQTQVQERITNYQVEAQREMIKRQLKFEVQREFSRQINDLLYQIEVHQNRSEFVTLQNSLHRLKSALENFSFTSGQFFSTGIIAEEIEHMIFNIAKWEKTQNWKDKGQLENLRQVRSVALSKLHSDTIL